MKINCPHCEQKYDLEESMINQNMECQACNKDFTISDTRKRVPCPMCSEMILNTAKICQYCKLSLNDDTNTNPQQVHVAKVDPFAEYHTEIQGKKNGPLTIIGMFGIILGCLVIAVGVPQTTKGDGSEGFFIILFGAFIGIACFLWARREKTPKPKGD